MSIYEPPTKSSTSRGPVVSVPKTVMDIFGIASHVTTTTASRTTRASSLKNIVSEKCVNYLVRHRINKHGQYVSNRKGGDLKFRVRV